MCNAKRPGRALSKCVTDEGIARRTYMRCYTRTHVKRLKHVAHHLSSVTSDKNLKEDSSEKKNQAITISMGYVF